MAAGNRRVRALAALAIGLAVSLVAAEILVRALDLAPSADREYDDYVADARVPWKFKPLSVRRGLAEYRHNSAGFRDVEHTIAKPPGVFRILGLGDSFTYGALSSFDASYLSRLEAELNARPGTHPRVEVIRAGIPRYYPEPERRLLESYGVAYSPDLVLVGFLPNDVVDTYYGPDFIRVDDRGNLRTREGERMPRAFAALAEHVALVRLVVQRYVDYRISRNFQPKFDEVYRAGGFHEKDWQKVEEEYGRMAAVAARIPARLVIVAIPQKGPWSEKHRYPGKRLATWAAENGVGFVDTLPAFERISGGPPLYHDEGHCTATGYGVIASAIFDDLTREGLVP